MMQFLTTEARRIRNTIIWSVAGWRSAWADQKSLRQWTLVNVLSAALAFHVDLTPAERALILALGLLVLAAELANTAIEETVNYISDQQHPLARKAKDCGSALVAMTALAGGAAWGVVLIG